MTALLDRTVPMLLAAMLLLVACRGPEARRPEAAEPAYPAVAPAGVPPVTGDGALALVPPGGERAAWVTAELGHGWTVTALVPPAGSILAVRLVRPPAEAWPAAPATDAGALVLAIELYADDGTGMRAHRAPVTVGIRPPIGIDVAVLMAVQLDEGVHSQLVPIERDPAAHVVTLRPDPAPRVVLALAEKRAIARLLGQGADESAVAASLAPDPVLAPTAAGAPPTLASPTGRAPLPARLTIQRLGIDAPIGPVGVEPNGAMASPEQGHVVGWYEPGARPGETSNAVLVGHVDRDKRPAVFHRLAELRAGDVIEVESGLGSLYRYVVDDMQSYPAREAPLADIFGPKSVPVLTLITCGGTFDRDRNEYADRVVVRASGV